MPVRGRLPAVLRNRRLCVRKSDLREMLAPRELAGLQSAVNHSAEEFSHAALKVWDSLSHADKAALWSMFEKCIKFRGL